MEFKEIREKVLKIKGAEKQKIFDLLINETEIEASNEEIGKKFKEICNWASKWCD